LRRPPPRAAKHQVVIGSGRHACFAAVPLSRARF
jgi:hypothetical protein